MQTIRKRARNFRDTDNLPFPLTLDDLNYNAKSKGWNLCTYSQAKRLIEEHNLHKYTDAKKAFTYIYNGEITILYDDNISYDDKLFCICHEIGHIDIRHICTDGLLGKERSAKKQAIVELEADTFALELLAPGYLLLKHGYTDIKSIVDNGILTEQNAIQQVKHCFPKTDFINKKRLIKQAAMIILALIVLVGTGFAIHINLYDKQTVFVTQTGSRYHVEDCYHIARYQSFEIALKEALERKLTACKTCYK